MEFFVYWLIFSIVVGVAAGSRGRSGFGWFLLSAIISPLLALILVLILPKANETTASVGGEAITAETHTRCPECRELIRVDARVCKHCRHRIAPLA